MNEIFTLFNSKDKEEIKNSVIKLILNQVEEDLEKMDVYLVDPDLIDDIIQEVREEVKEEIKQEYKHKLLKKIDTKFDFDLIN